MMNGPSGTMSPISADGSEWSAINQYQGALNKPDSPFSPTFSNPANLATPPSSGGGGGPTALVPPTNAGLPPNGPPRRLVDSGNPSPPNSVAARSSTGTLGDQQHGRRHQQMEEILSQHYAVLRRFLQSPNRDDRSNPKSTKARDKLLRLSPTQFHELSTDVYDELLRRQQAAPGQDRPPRPDVPPFLPPRESFHEKRNQARQKLASLQYQRFRDLATDVFCELERRFPQFAARDVSRRGSPTPSMRSTTSHGRPSMMNGYGPRPGPYGPPASRRSQSRGPPPVRMGRGYPSGGPPPGAFPPRQASLGGPSPGTNAEPVPKSFQSNTIVPNKSTLVEDDDDAVGIDSDYDTRSDAFGLDSGLQSRRGTNTLGDSERRLLAEAQVQVSTLEDKVTKLEELVKTKEEKISRLEEERDRWKASITEQEEWKELKLELEDKLSKAENLNSSLQQELDRVREEQEDMERNLRSQIDEASRSSKGDEEWQTRYQSLQEELQQQQQVTEEVRREASTFLIEMRNLSEQSQSNWEREERLSGQVQRLQEEVKEWKSRYVKAKTQLRHLRSSSVGISDMQSAIGSVSKQNELIEPDGVVKDVHVTRFQMSVDELLRMARLEEPKTVLDQVKAVIFAVRYILQDVNIAAGLSAETNTVSAKAKGRVSATANNLITASKNFAYSNGLSPVSLLDAAASHLCTSMVELLRQVKIRPTPAEELEVDEDIEVARMQSPDYFSAVPSTGRFSNNESVYSAISAPSEESLNASALQHMNGVSTDLKVPLAEDQEIRELKHYLEDQTDNLLQSIQDLVASIRGDDDPSTIRRHVSAISSFVTNIVQSSEDCINKSSIHYETLQQRCGSIIQNLETCRRRLVEPDVEEEEKDEDERNPARTSSSTLPPIAFEIARQTKELVQCLEQPGCGDDGDDFN